MMRIWLDDIRKAPEGFVHAHSVNEAKLLVIECENTGEEYGGILSLGEYR